ncbi:hypothetical protein F0P96_18305 [Hymenobacter busanensis]|uniref:Uncharacterized protein n=1 Tax=Hymenobacter busanensis TaxID=2607656 RepID=A0A7L4ZSH8_9BACT|nr:hypothetical protein [Hymenobacter busanensis]KAA9327190.1 hypothetical protein F0P96_18305 [Hymenobacter busanensis]QHJ05857.1 hypothetical protein GUY19_00510 [Hymenobacter busanensis]
MKNDLVESRLRRDTALDAFLAAEVDHYTDIEDDVAPLRQQLHQALAQADALTDQVLNADNDNAPARKKGLRNQLTLLLRRLTVALQAVASSTNDNRLLALSGQVSNLRRLSDASFVEEARRLLSFAPERSGPLSKRRFLPDHYQQAMALYNELRRAAPEARLTDADGSSGRQALERLIKQNARTIEQLRTFFRIYEQDEPELWSRFQAAAKVVKRGSAEGATPA